MRFVVSHIPLEHEFKTFLFIKRNGQYYFYRRVTVGLDEKEKYIDINFYF